MFYSFLSNTFNLIFDFHDSDFVFFLDSSIVRSFSSAHIFYLLFSPYIAIEKGTKRNPYPELRPDLRPGPCPDPDPDP